MSLKKESSTKHNAKPSTHATFIITNAYEEIVTETDDAGINWSDLIFLPFHPVFSMFVLFAVMIKATLGPIQSVFPIVYCNDAMDHHPVTIFIKYTYWYMCDFLYGIDTFLHIAHRQVVDKALRRQHLPKPAFFLGLDLLSLIPFLRFLETNPCPRAQLWPNLLGFNEFLITYRVTHYFSLLTTHSFWLFIVGYTIVMAMFINAITCLMLLATAQGFCNDCNEPGNHYDWRSYMWYKMNKSDNYSTYVYGASYVTAFAIHAEVDETKPSAIFEFLMISVFMLGGYLLIYFIIIPKSIAESLLRVREICIRYPAVQKIMEESKRRDPYSNHHLIIKQFYTLIWERRSGIIQEPELLRQLPVYLRLELKFDLLWPIYYHSSLLRQTSHIFRRWLCEHVIISYKLPGEKFFAGGQSASTFFYLKSGIVQLTSADDGVEPILSVTSGTIFGEINFLVPNIKRKVLVRCVTYCEVFYIHRRTMLRALLNYPTERRKILSIVSERMNHAKLLYNNKLHVMGLDRTEKEGIAWLTRRWWEIYELIERTAKQSGKFSQYVKNHITHEQTIYHCAKYIGLIVLCTRTVLQTKSMFSRYTFPWIISPNTKFGSIWNRIVIVQVMLVVLIYPQNLITAEKRTWFIYFTHWIDLIYILDIVIALFTAIKKETNNIVTVIFERFKSFTFMLDVLSTIWIENLAEVLGSPQYYYTFQFNRLIKVYRLFYGQEFLWDINKNPIFGILRNVTLVNLTYTMITSHIVYELTCYLELTMNYFFGERLCTKTVNDQCQKIHPATGVTIFWEFEIAYNEFLPKTLSDLYVAVALAHLQFLLYIYCQGRIIAYMYFKNRDIEKYHSFVCSILNYYEQHKLHQDLLKRLERYLICHWKYYQGYDVLYSNSLNNEPFEVYWKANGHTAEKVISQSRPFHGADPRLLRKLASEAKFLLLPRNATIFLFGFQINIVTWIVQGHVKGEYSSDDGALQYQYYGPGDLLSISAVFFGECSLRTYTTTTECEILYIPLKVFYAIYNKYEVEKKFLDNCLKEFRTTFDDLFKREVLSHTHNQRILRHQLAEQRKSMISSGLIADIPNYRSLPFEGEFWGNVESGFMRSWFLFRAIIVCVSIVSASMLGGVGAVTRWVFMMISAFCDCIAWIDIIMKLFLSYYDERGLLITDKKKCLINYLSKSFLLDIIGAFPWYSLARYMLTNGIDYENCFLINTVCKFAHIYIVFAYFHYISDKPTVNITVIKIIKWQVINILIVLAVSHYLMVNCVHFKFQGLYLQEIIRRNECWMPDFYRMPDKLNGYQLHLIFAQSLNLVEGGMTRTNFGRFKINREYIGVGCVLLFLGLVFWFITCYTVILLVLNGRGDTVFKQGVQQLDRFLKSERVDKKTIKNCMDHFRYCWVRTKGINIQQQINNRIGVMYRQDISYYSYKQTFSILAPILNIGDMMQRQLASVCSQVYYLPEQDIIREMDIHPKVCIIHRGKINVFKDGKKIMILTKGDIFGQLRGTHPRPIRVTATAQSHVDLLIIDVAAFQEIINDEVRDRIARNPQSRRDFMAAKNIFVENPYDTVQYILRGMKTIMLPRSEAPTQAVYGTWYARWLHFAWFIGPILATSCVISFIILPPNSVLWWRIYFVVFITDLGHLLHCISEFYTIELVVENAKCVPRHTGIRGQIKKFSFYADLLTFLIPLLTLVTNDWRYQLARALRLMWLVDFNKYFCSTFKARATPIVLKGSILLLLLHCLTCGWIYFGCRNVVYPFSITDMRNMTDIVDFSQWSHPADRGTGCARVTRNIHDQHGMNSPTYVVPNYWPHDYVVAMTYILLIHTHTATDAVIALSLRQVYYKVIATFFMYLLDMWILAVAINVAYTKYRELYKYDFLVMNLMQYLSDCGICKSLKESVLQYAQQVWQRQHGDWLPELAHQAPPCLRQDLFSALYMHHLDEPPLFRGIPYYFKRQLAARLKRMVVFPGKCIVREGDTFSTMFFVHEGEIEKWFNDERGEGVMLSVLYTNSYFGIISGLFTNSSFQFSYYARTVVDLVYLELQAWRDLLDAYPEIKVYVYKRAHDMVKFYESNAYGKHNTGEDKN